MIGGILAIALFFSFFSWCLQFIPFKPSLAMEYFELDGLDSFHMYYLFSATDAARERRRLLTTQGAPFLSSSASVASCSILHPWWLWSSKLVFWPTSTPRYFFFFVSAVWSSIVHSWHICLHFPTTQTLCRKGVMILISSKLVFRHISAP